MNTGSRSWQGITILVFGRIPTLPSTLEIQISDALPANEARIQSFESYEQALEFCKDEKNVGFFLLLDDNTTPGVAEVFRNLANPYGLSGWPAFGAVLYDQKKSIDGVEQLLADRRLFSYLPIQDFSTSTKCAQTMAMLGEKFISETGNTLFSERFRESVLSCANSTLPSGSLSFYDRSLTILASNLNLSWREMLCLRWTPSIAATTEHYPSVLKPHEDMMALFSDVPSSVPMKTEPLVELCKDKQTPLHLRLYQVLQHLDQMRLSGKLHSAIENLAQNAKPGAPAILKAIRQNRSLLLHISEDQRAFA